MSFQDLIPVVNKLQDIVTTTQVSDIDLPILAVVVLNLVVNPLCWRILLVKIFTSRNWDRY